MSVRRRLASIVVASLAAAAAARGQQSAPPSTAALAQDPRVVSALELARAWLEAQRAYERIPGISVAIVRDQDLLWSGGFGEADVADGRPAAADTLYSICSISKLFTSIAIMQQRDDGKLRLDDPVGQQLPWFHLKHAAGRRRRDDRGPAHARLGAAAGAEHRLLVGAGLSRCRRARRSSRRCGTIEALYAPETHLPVFEPRLRAPGRDRRGRRPGEPYGAYVRRRRSSARSALTSTTPVDPGGERGKRFATGYSSLDREGKRPPTPFFTMKGVDAAAGFASDADDLARFASWQLRLLASGGTEVLKATTLARCSASTGSSPTSRRSGASGSASGRATTRPSSATRAAARDFARRS